MKHSSELYSAAGHPPPIYWRRGKLERVESNGIPIGVMPDADYPVSEFLFGRRDRFL
jgi:serine phosphatase RsbU (regulator of sigma subunit)